MNRRDPLDMVKLTPLMERTSGRRETVVGLIDGPVALDHADLVGAPIHASSISRPAASTESAGAAREHGTFIAGILSARRQLGEALSPLPSVLAVLC